MQTSSRTTLTAAALLLWVEDDLARLQRGPLVPLNVVRQTDERRKDADRLDHHALAVVELGLGRPPQESGHILGDLGR